MEPAVESVAITHTHGLGVLRGGSGGGSIRNRANSVAYTFVHSPEPCQTSVSDVMVPLMTSPFAYSVETGPFRSPLCSYRIQHFAKTCRGPRRYDGVQEETTSRKRKGQHYRPRRSWEKSSVPAPWMAIFCRSTVVCRPREHFTLECPGETAVCSPSRRPTMLPHEGHMGYV